MAAGVLGKVSKLINSHLKSLQKKRDQITKEIDHLTSFFSGKSKSKSKAKAGKKKKGKRIRRSPEQLKALANDIVNFLKEKGGATPKEITEKFGTFLPSVKDFVAKHGKVKLKKKAKKYHA